MQPEALAEYLLDLGGALLSAGCPTHRLEQALFELAKNEGMTAEVFAVPTGLFLSVRAPGQAPLQRMMRVPEWGVDLGRLAAVDRVIQDVVTRKLALADARKSLDDIDRMGSPYPAWVRWLASAGTAGATAVFFRGGQREVLVAAIGGLVIAALRAALERPGPGRLRPLHDFLGGLLAGLLAWGAFALVGRISREVVVLAILILLVPGMALTTGLAELVHKNLVSGAAKLMEAGMTLLSIVCGIAAAVALEHVLGGHEITVRARPAPGFPVELSALVVTALSVAVLFSVPRRLVPAAMVSVAIGWLATGLGSRLPGSIAAFLAALAVSLYANAVARVTDRPAQVFQVPGLVLLVPGSFGFLSLDAFLEGQFAGGAAKAFEMFLVAAAIVTGLVVAQVVLPAKKLL